MAVLDEATLRDELSRLSGWTGDTTAISKTYVFEKFMDGIEFVRRVAEIAEKHDHHPDIDIRWTKVTLRLSTHSEGGVTPKDLELARAVDAAG